MSKAKIFLICPERNSQPEVQERIAAYVAGLQAQGHPVYWPARDTDQADPVGLTICKANLFAMYQAHEIHIWYDPTSQGSIFDLGAALMASEHIQKKRFVIANPEAVQGTEGKSFQNVLLALAVPEKV